jgi:hypothetical protein
MFVFECFKRWGGGCDVTDSRHGLLSTAQNLGTVKMFFEPVDKPKVVVGSTGR